MTEVETVASQNKKIRWFVNDRPKDFGKEARLLVEEDKTVKVDKIKHIKPLSDELKQWMPKQWQIYKRKKGLILDDEEAESLTA